MARVRHPRKAAGSVQVVAGPGTPPAVRNPNDSTQQARGGVYVSTALGVVCVVVGLVTGSLGTVAIGVAVLLGGLLLLRLSR